MHRNAAVAPYEKDAMTVQPASKKNANNMMKYKVLYCCNVSVIYMSVRVCVCATKKFH